MQSYQGYSQGFHQLNRPTQVSPRPVTPRSQPLTNMGQPLTPQHRPVTQGLPSTANASPQTDIEDYEEDPGQRALSQYNQRAATLSVAQMEQDNRFGQIAEEYPTPVRTNTMPPTASVHMHSQPQVHTAMPMNGANMMGHISDPQLIAARTRRGHRYGPIRVEGDGVALRGNIYDNPAVLPYLPDHYYSEGVIARGSRGTIIDGEFASTFAERVLNRGGGEILPPTDEDGTQIHAIRRAP